MRIQRNRGQYHVNLPKKWVKDNTDPEDKLLFLEEIEKGFAHAYVGRSFYDKRIALPADESGSGAGETGQAGHGEGFAGGVGEQSEELRPVAADSGDEGK